MAQDGVEFCGLRDDGSIIKTKEECDSKTLMNCVPCNARPDGKNCNPWQCDDYTSKEDCEGDPHEIRTRESHPCQWGLAPFANEETCETFLCKNYATQEECEANAQKLVKSGSRLRDSDGVLGLGAFETCRWLEVRSKMKCESVDCTDYKDEAACTADENKIIGGCAMQEKYGKLQCMALADESPSAGEPDAQECAPPPPTTTAPPTPAPKEEPAATAAGTAAEDEDKDTDAGDPVGDCDLTAYNDALAACMEPVGKCVQDAGTDLPKICMCGDDQFTCLEKATTETKCEKQMKDSMDTARKSYEESKEASGCDSAAADGTLGITPGGSWAPLHLLVPTAAAALRLVPLH